MSLLAIKRGRALILSPDWGVDEPQVLFDACSGDFWLLEPAAAQLIQRLRSDGPVPRSQALDALVPHNDSPAALIAELLRVGILQEDVMQASGDAPAQGGDHLA